MGMRLLWLLLLLLCALLQPACAFDRRVFFTIKKTPKPVTDPIVQSTAQFAVDELKQLSDSGIYETLSLVKVYEAATETGDFHFITHLRVALASPYFQSQKPAEDFTMLVLESKEPLRTPTAKQKAFMNGRNATRSIAIDTFPVMDEDAIEEFWIQMVENRRRKRHELFDQWTREALGAESPVEAEASTSVDSTVRPVKKKTKKITIDELHAMPTKQLRQILLSKAQGSSELREVITSIIDARWDLLEQQEQTISTMA